MHDQRTPVLESLDAGLRVMEMFSRTEVVHVSDVARHLDVARSTAYRVLHTLAVRGVVALGESGRGYHAGPTLLGWAQPLGLDTDTRERLRPVLEEAAVSTRETVHLAALVGPQVLLFDGRESDQPLRAVLRTGYLRPAYAISAGKLMLSRLSEPQVRALFPTEALARLTATTLSTVTDLMMELADIRDSDHALSYAEAEAGLNGVAVMVEGKTWRDRTALLASVPVERGSLAEMLRVRSLLMDACQLLR